MVRVGNPTHRTIQSTPASLPITLLLHRPEAVSGYPKPFEIPRPEDGVLRGQLMKQGEARFRHAAILQYPHTFQHVCGHCIPVGVFRRLNKWSGGGGPPPVVLVASPRGAGPDRARTCQPEVRHWPCLLRTGPVFPPGRRWDLESTGQPAGHYRTHSLKPRSRTGRASPQPMPPPPTVCGCRTSRSSRPRMPTSPPFP